MFKRTSTGQQGRTAHSRSQSNTPMETQEIVQQFRPSNDKENYLSKSGRFEIGSTSPLNAGQLLRAETTRLLRQSPRTPYPSFYLRAEICRKMKYLVLREKDLIQQVWSERKISNAVHGQEG